MNHTQRDKEFLALLVTAPDDGLAAIMDAYTAFAWTIVHGKLSGAFGKHDIEECVSDVFYELYKTRNAIDLEKGSLKAYIAVLAKRRAVDTYRKLYKTTMNVSLDENDNEWLISPHNAEQSVIDNETKEQLIREIKTLGEPDSRIVICKYYLGHDTKTIAKALGLKPNTVDKKASRALEKLRTKLEPTLGGTL